VRTPMAMPPVEVFAMYAEDEFQPLAPLVTRFAVEVSRQAPAGTTGPSLLAASRGPRRRPKRPARARRKAG
jgi:hypothetical protein